jgi:hypothetical protein
MTSITSSYIVESIDVTTLSQARVGECGQNSQNPKPENSKIQKFGSFLEFETIVFEGVHCAGDLAMRRTQSSQAVAGWLFLALSVGHNKYLARIQNSCR